MTGNLDELRIHLSAVAKMVKMRGGLQNLGWQGVLQMFLSWWVQLTTRQQFRVFPIRNADKVSFLHL